MKILQMLKFVPGHLKTLKNVQHAVKKLPFVIRYVPDQYKTQQMCDKAGLEKFGELELLLTAIKISKYVIKLLTISLMHLLILNQH